MSGKPVVIIYDRGMMDLSAYMTPDSWQALLDDLNLSVVQVRDKRYDAIIHLCTAAKGAEEFYTTANNDARTETPMQAIAIDDRLINAWTGHPHLRIVGNSGTFNQKINKVIDEIAIVLGVPEPIETERKYLIQIISELPSYSESVIFQTYLLSDDGSELRVRKRGQNGSFIYFLTSKRTLNSTSRIETERQISPAEYIQYLSHADPARTTIHKLRKCFIWENQYFEIDTFLNPPLEMPLLEIEGVSDHNEIKFPPCLKVIEDVTERKEYYNANISMIRGLAKNDTMKLKE